MACSKSVHMFKKFYFCGEYEPFKPYNKNKNIRAGNVIPNCIMYHKILHKTTMLLSFFPLAEPENAIDSKIASLLTWS